MWFKIFKYISITKRLMRISKALGKAAPDVIAFLFVFCILFIGFGISGHLLFGNDMANFANVTITFLTLYRMMLGDWDYDSIMLSAPVMGPVSGMLFHCCVFLTAKR
jgi:polycystin 2